MKLPFSDIPFVPVYAVIRKNLFFLRCHVLKPNRYLSPPPPVVIAIIAILAAILLPALQQARERAKATQCMSTRKQIGMWIFNYTEAFDGRMMKSGDAASNAWYNYMYEGKITKYRRLDQFFGCPSKPIPADSTSGLTTDGIPRTSGNSIAYNKHMSLKKFTVIKRPAIKYVISDATFGVYFGRKKPTGYPV